MKNVFSPRPKKRCINLYILVLLNQREKMCFSCKHCRAELYGCCHGEIQEAFNCSGSSTALVYSDRPYKWRHFAVDPVNNIIYFCDYHWEINRIFCFSAPLNDYSTVVYLYFYATITRKTRIIIGILFGICAFSLDLWDHSL